MQSSDRPKRCPATAENASRGTVYWCDLDEGHEGDHVGKFLNGKPLGWPQEPTGGRQVIANRRSSEWSEAQA